MIKYGRLVHQVSQDPDYDKLPRISKELKSARNLIQGLHENFATIPSTCQTMASKADSGRTTDEKSRELNARNTSQEVSWRA